MKIRELFRPKDVVTLVGAALGFTAVVAMAKSHFFVASILLICAAVLDILDGKIARKVGPTRYGHYLDLADLASFGVAPALFIILWFQPVLKSLLGFMIYAAALTLFLCGLLRLARFFTIESKDSIGVPITLNGFLMPLLWFLHSPELAVIIIVFITSFFMTSTYRIPKF